MSKQKIPPLAMDSATKSRHVVEPYQPVWMAHWLRPQVDAPLVQKNEKLDRVPRDGDFLNDPTPVKESKIAILGSVRGKNEMTSGSATNNDQETDNEGSLRQEVGHISERGKTLGRKLTTQSSTGVTVLKRECSSLGEGTSYNSTECVKAFKRMFPDSSTHIHPSYDLERREFGKGKTVVSPSMVRPSAVSNNQERCHKYSDAPDIVCERSMDRDFNQPLLIDAPSTSKRHLAIVGPNSFQEMQKKCSGIIPLLPSQFIASEKPESKKSRYNFYSVQKLPNCVDMETMRICTTVDSVEATPEGFPRFSTTTHSLLITKKADADAIPKEVYRTAQLITDMDGNTSRDIHSLWPFSCQGSRGVTLQPLSSFSNSEDRINVQDAKGSKVTIRNESSADTDIMDMDFCKEENSNPGANGTSLIKDFATTSREVAHSEKKKWLPDINLELPALPAIPSSSENAHASSSRTQSLEMDALMAHSEQPKRKLDHCFGNSSESDPFMRWVKRLKLSSSPNSSSRGTRTPPFPENLPSDKMGIFFRNIQDIGIGSSKPTNHHSPKESVPLDNNGYHLLKYNDDSMTDAIKKDKEILFSQTWIKRWLQNRPKFTEKNPVMGEPRNSKSSGPTDKDFPPSIAAMALMGKALNGLQPCDLQKQGSFTVWNTQGILKDTL